MLDKMYTQNPIIVETITEKERKKVHHSEKPEIERSDEDVILLIGEHGVKFVLVGNFG